MGIARSSVIVLKIDVVHMFAVHTKREAKVGCHPYASLAAPASFELMQAPTRKLGDLLNPRGLLDRIKHRSELGHQIGGNAPDVIRFEKTLETPVPKLADLHDRLYGITVRLSKQTSD
jgi:hypothetical protein